MLSLRRLRWALEYEGLKTTGLRCVGKALQFLGMDVRESRWWPRTKEFRFDNESGVDTATFTGQVPPDMTQDQQQQAVAYEPTSAPEFRWVMSGLAIDHERFVFIDYGSGKGRVLMLACELPFKRVMGVELSRELHETALLNLVKYAAVSRPCGDCVSVCEDATALELPDDPLVLYLFNPFKERILADVLANIEASWRRKPRDLWIVYNNPAHRQLLDDRSFLREVRTEFGGRWVIYETQGSLPPESVEVMTTADCTPLTTADD